MLTLQNEKTPQMSDRKSLQKWAQENLKGQTIIPVSFGKPIEFTTKGIKEYLNQPHKYYQEKNELIRVMPQIIKNAKYIGEATCHKESRYLVASHIFEILLNGEKTWLIARENIEGIINFHSISDNENVLLSLKK